MDEARQEEEEFFSAAPVPGDLPIVCEAAEAFLRRHTSAGRPVALVTSGGTSVPLERRTVRSLDNFSTGGRGARSAECFLSEGFAVVFLHRDTSLRPFSRHFSGQNLLDWFDLTEESVGPNVNFLPEPKEKLLPVLSAYKRVKELGTLFPVSFTSLFHYLHYLRALARLMGAWGQRSLIYLAAAVSDFYVHPEDMPEHKIQSSSLSDGLTLKLRSTPKMVGALTHTWAPSVFTVTFKLETDESLLVSKARDALAKYGHQVVVANKLGSHMSSVILVTRDSETKISLEDDEDSSPAPLELGSAPHTHLAPLERKIVRELVSRYRTFVENHQS